MSDRIVVVDGYTLVPTPDVDGELTWRGVEALGELRVFDRSHTADEVMERAAGATVVLTNKAPMSAQVLAALPDLRYIGVTATGVNVVDLDAARQRGVIVTNVPGYGAASVAQHAMALLLELVNHVGAHDAAVKAGQWTRCPDFSFTLAPMTELEGKALGVVGMGAIGQRVARIGAALGMRIIAANQRSMASVTVPGVDIAWMDHDALFAEADVVTLHCPLTEQTHHLVNAARLATMKRTAMVINTGRGDLVDEQALVAALEAGQIAGAGVDVLSKEPPSDHNPMLTAPRCIVTPHNAWASLEARRRLMAIVVDNIKAWQAEAPVNVVS